MREETIGSVTASGIVAFVEAGEAITALDVCYVKASDGKAYKLDTGMAEVDTSLVIMAIETMLTAVIGRFIFKGTVEYSSWSLTPGNRVIVSVTAGLVGEETE